MPSFEVTINGKNYDVDAANAQAAAQAAATYAKKSPPNPAAADAKRRTDGTPDLLRAITGGILLGGADEMSAAGSALETRLFGKALGKNYTPRQAYDAVLAEERRQDQEYLKDHPLAARASNIGGGIAGLLTSPGLGLGEWVGAGLGGKGLAAVTARSATAGAGLGAVTGALSAEPGERVQGAKSGAVIGGTVGAVAPGAVAAGKSLLRPVLRAANSATVKYTGGTLPGMGTDGQVARRLGEAMKADGYTPEQIAAVSDEWARTGSPPASFMDAISQGGGGQRTMALLRGAASKGGGRNVANQYNRRVEADLQPAAISRTRALTPDQRTVQQATDDIAAQRSAGAQTDYGPVYVQPAELSDAARKALSGAPGRAALMRARSAAEAQMRPDQMAEIDALLQGKDGPLSVATLDRVRIAMGERAQVAARRGANDMRAGLSARTAGIDSALDQVEGMAPARANFKGFSQQLEGLDKPSASMLPDDLAAFLNESPGARQTAPLAYARDLEARIGSQPEAALGALNRIAGSTNQGRNLSEVFGPQAGQDYQTAIGNMADQVENARFINPNRGSQTFGRLADEGSIDVPTSKAGVLSWLAGKIEAGATLTDAERELLVTIGTTDASRVAPALQSLPQGPSVIRPSLPAGSYLGRDQ